MKFFTKRAGLAALFLTGALAAAAAAQDSQPAGGAMEKPADKGAAMKGEMKADKDAVIDKAALLDPSKLTAKAPETFKVKFVTSKGNFVVAVTRAWSPNGADRFYNLVNHGFYNECRFFRVISGFMAQFGINGDPAINTAWQPAKIDDDPVKQSNKRGYVSYAMAGPNTRTTQLFINFNDKNAGLDGQGFSPFGQVIEGMDVVDKLDSEYGEGAPRGKGPDQGMIQSQGNSYLMKGWPNLDYIKTATVMK